MIIFGSLVLAMGHTRERRSSSPKVGPIFVQVPSSFLLYITDNLRNGQSQYLNIDW